MRREPVVTSISIKPIVTATSSSMRVKPELFLSIATNQGRLIFWGRFVGFYVRPCARDIDTFNGDVVGQG